MAMKSVALKVKKLEDGFIPILQKCETIRDLKKAHVPIIKFSLSDSNFLVTKMVGICDTNKDMVYAHKLFKQVTEPNMYLYNALIRAYTHNHFYKLAIDVYKQLLKDPQGKNHVFPDKFTSPSLIKVCTALMNQELGFQVHAQVCKFGPKLSFATGNLLLHMYSKFDDLKSVCKVFEEMTERDVFSWNCLISGHARLGQMKKARLIFEEMPEKTIVTWTTMISGYTRIECYSDALHVFQQMQEVDGVKPDVISIIAVLPACAKLGALEIGKWIHMYCDKKGFLEHRCVCNALIEMYAKCGEINQAMDLFTQMSAKDVISWSTMIVGQANHGRARQAVELFQEMQKSEVKPNVITFVGVLSACAHAGFLVEGLKYFESMTETYCIEPGIEHYSCLVDLLGRCGCLDRALQVINKMPMKPDATIWGSLLSSCRTYGNLEIAVVAMEHLLELEPDDTGNLVLLSNLYADLGKWNGVSRMRKFIRSKRMKKTPGCSSIEVNNVVQEFLSGDYSKSFSEAIFQILELIASQQSKSNDEPEEMLEDMYI
ncbi:Pentatricopeptide repeat [Dillenia turbinata]|uniref:Pentatricopeptide repeat n=1 Tax=Dillenia turbinata TaxID=194707 RepID=A0AAN8VGW8_9MAGN